MCVRERDRERELEREIECCTRESKCVYERERELERKIKRVCITLREK